MINDLNIKPLIFILLNVSFILPLNQVYSQELKLPALIADNMVLQREDTVSVWGWTKPNSTVTIQVGWSTNLFTCTSQDDGVWRTEITTPAAGGPYTILISDDHDSISINNVLIGEVWVCSGQSNMAMPMSGFLPSAPLLDSENEIKNADYPDIRLFRVMYDKSVVPKKDCEGSWMECSPESVRNFSAVAYFYGRELYRRLNIPIGLIQSAWGGTQAEPWMSYSSLQHFDSLQDKLTRIKDIMDNYSVYSAYDRNKIYNWGMNPDNINLRYSKVDYDDSNWQETRLPGYWEFSGFPEKDGVVWYRKTINIPDSWDENNLILSLGSIDDVDITWFNGYRIGETKGRYSYKKERRYIIPKETINKKGENVVSVRVLDLGGKGGFYGSGNEMYLAIADGNKRYINLSGKWKYKLIKDSLKLKTHINKSSDPSVLFNAMISPLTFYNIKGVIWYQGESNIWERPNSYFNIFSSLIHDWRKNWNRSTLPFYFVQIAPFNYNSKGKSSVIRNAQRQVMKTVHNTGMVVTMDIGDLNNIHPANKQTVGKRLAFGVLNKTYKMNIGKDYTGPIYEFSERIGSKIYSYFSHMGKTQTRKLYNFEIAAKDSVFVPAKAVITKKQNMIKISSKKIKKPVWVRYLWSDTSVSELTNEANLPTSPFISERID